MNRIDPFGLSEDGYAYLSSYADAILHSWPWQWPEIVFSPTYDIGPYESGTYNYLGMDLSASQMGNVGPGYAFAQVTGGLSNPFGMFVVAGGAFWGEVLTNSSMPWNEGAPILQGIADAVSSFFWNWVGYMHGAIPFLPPD